MKKNQLIEEKKTKVRGRPFLKGNKKGKPQESHLEAQGTDDNKKENGISLESKDTGISPDTGLFKDMPLIKPNPIFAPMPEGTKSPHDYIPFRKDVMIPEPELKITNVLENQNVIIDSIEFKNGKDVLKIVLLKKSNRMFRIQVFLNDDTEIRPVTYTGSSMGNSYWKLLKSSLKGI